MNVKCDRETYLIGCMRAESVAWRVFSFILTSARKGGNTQLGGTPNQGNLIMSDFEGGTQAICEYQLNCQLERDLSLPTGDPN